ncbi:MAG TPA: tRNA lysidine(34) synthetase TilS [Geobacteraceae bacterium]|nr:tRNA lysidine(34) synthetase TilS [Geobacteraceae bacterium]
MLKKVSEFIRENRLFTRGDMVVVAVSGGADSVALLDILASLVKLRLTLIVAHLNHGLRGEESDADAIFVERLAAQYGVPVELKRVEVASIARARKLSLEEAGRVARYEWFDRVAAARRACSVALGHHADDQAETFLLRLFRGSGTTGLASMRPRSLERYVRPLLTLTREEIIAYLKRRGLSWRHDSSNDETDFLRNRIRHECLPYLRTYNPAINERLATTAEILAADEALLEKLTDQVFPRLSRVASDNVVLDLNAVRAELPGLRYRLYRRAILSLKGNLARISAHHLKQIDEMVCAFMSRGEQSLPGGLAVMRCYEELHFLLKGRGQPKEFGELLIDGAGNYPLADGCILRVRLTAPPRELQSVSRFRAYFDLGRTPFPWTLRTFRPGDRFRPFGMTGTRKVKDFFIDEKIPVPVRRRIPLLFSAEELIWVCGLRVAESGRILPGTALVAEIEITGNTPYSSCKTAGRMVFHQEY